jgi:hypothetical protein
MLRRTVGFALLPFLSIGLLVSPGLASAKPCAPLSLAYPGYACKVKPNRLDVSVTNGVHSIHWSHWGKKTAIGKGSLNGTDFGPGSARVKWTRPIKCSKHKRAFSFVVVKYGPGFKKGLARGKIRGVCD